MKARGDPQQFANSAEIRFLNYTPHENSVAVQVTNNGGNNPKWNVEDINIYCTVRCFDKLFVTF